MMKKLGILMVFLCGIGASWFSHEALAEDCDNLDRNRTWVNQFEKLQGSVIRGEYTEALQFANSLFQICSRSPAANYYAAQALAGLGENVKAVQFFQKASEYTSEFVVAPEMSRQIWYARYEAEYPERSDAGIAAIHEEMAKLRLELDERNEALDHLQTQVKTSADDAHEKYGAIMWSGAGIGIAGVAMTVVGGLFAFNAFDFDLYEDVTSDPRDDHRKYEIKNFYRAGWALFGAGLALTVTGAFMAGFGGYQYTHADENLTISVHVLPTSAAFEMVF